LKSAAVLVAGMGGLGCPSAVYLAAAGVGRIRLMDKERVDLDNLNRQILHWEGDVGRYNADSARSHPDEHFCSPDLGQTKIGQLKLASSVQYGGFQASSVPTSSDQCIPI